MEQRRIQTQNWTTYMYLFSKKCVYMLHNGYRYGEMFILKIVHLMYWNFKK